MDKKLKPCPFCGSKDDLLINDEDYEVFVFCWSCEARGPEMFSKNDAIEAWNRRADDGSRKSDGE